MRRAAEVKVTERTMTIYTKIDSRIWKRVTELAEEIGLPRSGLLNLALRNEIARQEKLQRAVVGAE